LVVRLLVKELFVVLTHTHGSLVHTHTLGHSPVVLHRGLRVIGLGASSASLSLARATDRPSAIHH
jgi:hypothetical protein